MQDKIGSGSVQTPHISLFNNKVQQNSSIQTNNKLSQMNKEEIESANTSGRQANASSNGNKNNVYMSAHNPQTPSNAQIRVLEQEEAAAAQQQQSANNEHQQHYRSHCDSQASMNKTPSTGGSRQAQDEQQQLQKKGSRNNLMTSTYNKNRHSQQQLNEERSLAFQQAAENQLRSSSNNLLEKLQPEVVLRGQIDNDKPNVYPMGVESSDTSPMNSNNMAVKQQFHQTDMSRAEYDVSSKNNNGKIIIPRSQFTKASQNSESLSPASGRSRVNQQQQQQQELIMQRNQGDDEEGEEEQQNMYDHHMIRQSYTDDSVMHQKQFNMISPQNHGFGELAEGLMADPTQHSDEGEDYDDDSSEGSMKGSGRGQADDDVKAADSAVQLIMRKESSKRSQMGRQSQMDMEKGEKDFNATALQHQSLLEPLAIDQQIARTPNLGLASTKNEETFQAKDNPSISVIKKQMMKEQRESQQSASGHEFSSSFRHVGIHILEMYNPLKKFYAQQQTTGKGAEKEKEAKKERKANDLLHQVDKQLKEVKAQQAIPEKSIMQALDKVQKLQQQQAGATTTQPAATVDLNSQSAQKAVAKNKQTNRARHPKLVANLFFTKYTIVRKVMKHDFKMRIEDNDDDTADLIWCDHCLPPERIMRMKPYQRTNHYPGMQALTRKNSLGKNLNGLRALFPEAFDFFPRTWLMPTDMRKLRAEWNQALTEKKDGLTLIVKPEASCQGKGIYLTRELDDIDIDDHCVVQEYINKPFLMEKMKFDLRLYVLVIGIDPLRIYLSREGLARLSTKMYEEADDSNIDDMTMHLTNYAINKHSTKFQPNRAAIVDSVGHKRSLKFTLKYLERCEGQNSKKLMKEIKDIIVKTLIAGQPIVADTMRSCQIDDFENSMCFEILGFDIMLDANCKPYLLEVNHSPSFSTDSPLDEKVKGELIRDTIRLLGISKKRKAMYSKNLKAHLDHRIMNGKYLRLPGNVKEQYRKEFDKLRDIYEQQNLGSFEQLYPCSEELQQEYEYEKLIKASRKIFSQKDQRNTSKAKRRITNLSQNQQLQNKSVSPNKRDRTTASKLPSAQQNLAAKQVQQQAQQQLGQDSPEKMVGVNQFQTPQ